MPGFVALLRGVNVGKAKRVPMAELRALLEGLGHSRVATLLNSGNVVFHAARGSATAHAAQISSALRERFGFDVTVVVKTGAEFGAIVAGNALADPGVDPSRLLVIFGQGPLQEAKLVPVADLVRAPERFLIGEHAAYLYCANGILESKAGEALLGKLGAAATSRNWSTTLKLQALLAAA